MSFPPGITTSGTMNMRNMIPPGIISGSASSKPIYCEGQIFQKFKYENLIKMKNELDPALLGGSFLFNEIKKGH
jgi:hypothetical protein